MDLTIFKNNLFEAGTEFFNQLGIRLNSNTAASLEAKELLKDKYKDKDIFKAIKETYFLGLVDDSVFGRNVPLLSKDKISLKEANNKITPEYNGLMVFAVKLPDSFSPTRGRIAELTRAFNRVSKNIPVVLLLKYSNLLSFATSERTKYKQEWREGEKIGKISLLKDINTDSPHTGHLKILYDLKVEPNVTDFNGLYQQWQEVFDVQLLNKKFYQELANWYFWAVKTVTFPDDSEKDKGVRNATNVIRLITRLIFVWFVKEKGLVPDKLFDPDFLKNILNYSDKTGSTYYKAILQNLFFATLNTDMNKDTPGSRKFVNRQYGIHYFYRYERFFTDKKKALALFENIPFLNGGLFECLDKNVGQNDETRIDCFSNSPPKADRLIVPDELFFSPEQAINLNEIYGTKGKSYKVRGIIDILNSYKFTIAENTPVEEEIALDPELLGKVFENLLASYNPETQTTARKQTGSFYTPREIVNYMVDESLTAYLSSKLTGHNSSSPPLEKGGKGGFEESYESRMRRLLTYTEEPHQFTVQEVDVLINAIDNAKILDPACGSGAFPMGVLHKMVHILHKLDPDNEKWKQRQINKVEELIRSAEKIDDSTAREQIVKDLEVNKQNIEDAFEHNELDYGRKLYLIENCIYGIDIQPIAVQIAKLRFFISLIVDQRIDTERKNLGIRPLPNLETKFVAANTLIGIEKPRFETLGLRNLEIDVKEKELKQVREKHFSARTPKTKDKYRFEDARLRTELAKLFREDGFSAETTHKLAHWDPYDQNASADFFDLEWMFGIKEGFDVVIANPPYISHVNYPQQDKEVLLKLFKTFKGRADLYVAFYEKGIDLLKNRGSLIYISPNKFFRAGYGTALRQYLNENTKIISIIDFGDSPIFDATTYPCVIQLEKGQSPEYTFTYLKTDNTCLDNLNGQQQYEKNYLTNEIWSFEDSLVASIWNKLWANSINLEKYIDKQFYRGIVTGLNNAFVIDENQKNALISVNPKISEIIKPYLKGKDVKRWYSKNNAYVLFTYHGIDIKKYPEILDYLRPFKSALEKRATAGKHEWYELQQPQTGIYHQFEKTKLISTDIAKRCEFTIDYSKSYIDATIFCMPIKDLYLLSILNSSLIETYYKSISSMIRGDFLRFKKIYVYRIPIKRIPVEKQQPFIKLVDQILSLKQSKPNADTTALEAKIDQLVYKLYGLTAGEIAIVEGKG